MTCRLVIAASLTVCLTTSAIARPPTLGDGLRAVGAFDDAHAVDPMLVPPPPSEAIWPRALAGSGIAIALAGVAGLLFSGGCETRDAGDRCVDIRGSDALWPSLIVLGLGATVTGSYWHRWSRLPQVTH